MRTGAINQSASGVLNAGGWQLIKDFQVPAASILEKLIIMGDGIYDSSQNARTVTASGFSSLAFDQWKFEEIGSSIYLDGINDYLECADSADWNFGTGDFTIDGWFRFPTLPGASIDYIIVSQYLNSTNFWYFSFANVGGTYKLILNAVLGGVQGILLNVSLSTTPSIDAWHHIAVVRTGNDFKAFFDGAQVGSTYTDTGAMPDIASLLRVGCIGVGGSPLKGYMNGFRIVKGNATWTAPFTTLPVYDDYGGARSRYVLQGAYEKLMLIGDTLNDSAGNTVTAYGNTAVTGAQYKFPESPYSIAFDGTNDYLSVQDSGDWFFDNRNFTVDFYVRWNSLSRSMLYAQAVDNNNHVEIYYYNAKLWLVSASGGVTMVSAWCSWTPSNSTWYHVAVERDGTTIYMFIDGVSQAVTQDTPIGTNSLPDLAAPVLISEISTDPGTWNINGWINGFRVYKDKARWTANFTPPTYTDYRLSGFCGNVDQEYRIVHRFINSSGVTAGYGWRLNGDAGGTNYGGQLMYGSSTTATGLRSVASAFTDFESATNGTLNFWDTTIQAKSGYVRTGIIKSADGISTTTVSNINLTGCFWNNTSDNVTSLVFYSDTYNGLGVGTHFLLFKRNLIGADAPVGIRTGTLNVQGKVTAGEFQKIYQTTLAAAATSVTISGLDGNTDVLYEVRARVITGAGGGGNEQVRPNNDAVDGNYGYQTLTGTNTTVGAARSTLTGMIFADGNSAGDVSFATMLLYAKSGYVRTSITQATNRIAATTVTNIKLIGNSWNNTADNITSIVIPTAAANGLGIGTVIELWALRKKV